MKKLYFLLMSGLCIMISQSCSKDVVKSPSPAAGLINVNLSTNQSYELSLGSGQVSIYQQATHYQTSQTNTNAETGSVTYKYVPQLNFTGNDEVIISTTTLVTSAASRSGCNHSKSSDNTATTSAQTSYTRINITVAN